MKKTLCFPLYVAIAAILFGSCATNNQVSDSAKAAQIEQLITIKHFTFVAEQALPSGGRSINLTSRYDLSINGDTLISFLPYYGRAFTAPIGRTGSGLQFTATEATIDTEKTRNGGYEMRILPNVQEVNQFALSISNNGSASLRVRSNNRDPITFYGYITSQSGKK